MRHRDFTALEGAVEHALEMGNERQALDLLLAERVTAQSSNDHARLAAVQYLAHRIYERTEWTVAADAARLLGDLGRSTRRDGQAA